MTTTKPLAPCPGDGVDHAEPCADVRRVLARRTIGRRMVPPADAVISAVGYLRRAAKQLHADRVGGEVTPAGLRQLADGMHVIGGRLLDAADAFESGASRMPVSDTTTTKGSAS